MMVDELIYKFIVFHIFILNFLSSTTMNYFSIAIMFLIGGLSQVHSSPLPLTEEPACVNAKPICTADGANFLAATDTAILFSERKNNYGCLRRKPNPAWFYLKIDQSGEINMSLSAPSDIDFIVSGAKRTRRLHMLLSIFCSIIADHFLSYLCLFIVSLFPLLSTCLSDLGSL